MKNLGNISNNKDVVNKEYVDSGLGNKMDAIQLTSPVYIYQLEPKKIYIAPKNCKFYYKNTGYFSVRSSTLVFIYEDYSNSSNKKFWVLGNDLYDYIWYGNSYTTSTGGTGGVVYNMQITDSYLKSQIYTSAYCTTSASTSAKTATCTNYTLTPNTWLHITMTSANSYDGAITLNVNNTGAKPVYINGVASSSSNKTLPAGTYLIYYDGTNYYFRTDGKLIDDSNYENSSNKVISISSSSTDTQYPSAKCVYDLVGNIETLLSQV